MNDWLTVHRGDAPLLLALPHTGADIPAEIESRFVSPWLARKDADWHIDRLYAFAAGMDATIVRTAISRSMIDVNRDPSGASLYPGQATTELCPATTFDDEPLYRPGFAPDPAEIAARRARWFAPYHAALDAEIARLRAEHPAIVIYDCHSIRSRIPRLFDGELPQFNIGTNGGKTCSPALQARVEAACRSSCSFPGEGRGPAGDAPGKKRHPDKPPLSMLGPGLRRGSEERGGDWTTVVNGRFRGGWTTRHYGRPERGVHAIQMELAIRGYAPEPDAPDAANWPPPYDPARAAPLIAILGDVLAACLAFARDQA